MVLLYDCCETKKGCPWQEHHVESLTDYSFHTVDMYFKKLHSNFNWIRHKLQTTV